MTLPLPRSATNHPAAWLQEQVSQAIERSLEIENTPRYWRQPLAAVADASDPLFRELKTVIGADHALPKDLLPDARSVIVYFLPFVRRLGVENAQAGLLASRSWAESYVATNQLIKFINDHLHKQLARFGYAVAVTPATHNFDQQRLLSGWSHKHVAYISGLGKFGRNQLLITEKGCCGRLGSLVTSAPFIPTPRNEKPYCLVEAGQECLLCVKNCVAGALSESAFDRHRCYRQLLENDAHYQDLPLVDVCGKCACELPCSYRIPGPM